MTSDFTCTSYKTAVGSLKAASPRVGSAVEVVLVEQALAFAKVRPRIEAIEEIILADEGFYRKLAEKAGQITIFSSEISRPSYHEPVESL
ncbi:MAG: hypothetical protein LBE44_03630 [Microbacterium hominis]|jgi:hypothetical protein|nr:hypothetical protein [Microbacterium hominis]